MARTSQLVQVGNRRIELSNLRKVLFPEDGIVKAELVEYYLRIAPTLLAHVKGRPLTLVRFPDGVHGERFYQKNRPDWTPEWMDHVKLGEGGRAGGEAPSAAGEAPSAAGERARAAGERASAAGEPASVDYLLASEEACLVWLANLATIELHQLHSRKPRFENPDYIVFDLDPPEGFPFSRVVETALELRAHLEGYGYHAFAKTTGRKGIHILLPIDPKWSFDEILEAASAMAKPFVASRRERTTLAMSKERRTDKILVDIYRNRRFQSIVSPYSPRGAPGAAVSMPLSWEELERLEDPRRWNIGNVAERVIREGDAWESIGAHAVTLHTARKTASARAGKGARSARGRSGAGAKAGGAADAAANPRVKTPRQLEAYAGKRSFDRTPEPAPAPVVGEGTAFTVHRHHASRLHYDLRLERDGTLKCWAVPKGLPPRPGVKRLAVATEDHPLEYITFHGTIPKGQYGGGEMWIYATGKYEITKEKKDGGLYLRLQSRELTAEYRLFPTRGRDWLLERLDPPQVDYLRDPVEPMLASSARKVPASPDYLYEIKWDGIRAMVSLDEGEIRLRSRNGRDVSALFPELLDAESAFRAAGGLFDAEIVCLDPDGRPNFKNVIHRVQQSSERAVTRARARHPAVCYLFDCLYLDGRALIHDPLERRRAWLADSVRPNPVHRLSEEVEDGQALFQAAKGMGLEGIVAKERSGLYHPGKRTEQWIKIKSRETMDCLVIGYTPGKGARADTFGALHLAAEEEGRLRYLGKVGTGLDDRALKEVLTALRKVRQAERPVEEKPLDDAETVWLEPVLACEVQYASLTSAGTLREPVFLRMRPDLGRQA